MKQNTYLLLKILLLVLLLNTNTNVAQNVGIGSESFTPDQSAVLELKSTEQGFLPPRMTTAERDLIESPAEMLIIANITTKCFEFYANGIWQTMSCAECPVPNAPTAGTHVPSETQIVWNWNSVGGADGYKYNTVNDFTTATNNGTSTTSTQTGLDCGTEYTLYVWSYNNCGKSNVLILQQNTSACPPCAGVIPPSKSGGGTYSIIGIGTQCWLAENLNEPHSSGNSWCYNSSTFFCDAYGRLYNWTAAMNNQLSSNLNPSGIRGICPVGWHLPSNLEWNQLLTYLSSNSQHWCDGNSQNIGKSISDAGWASDATLCAIGNNQTSNNSTGFSALPGGFSFNSGSHLSVGEGATWWTSTESNSSNAGRISLYYTSKSVDFLDSIDKNRGHSVRCIKD